MRWYHYLTIIITAALAYLAGWLVEWYTSPLAPHICVAGQQQTATQYLAVVLKSIEYELFWGGITIAAFLAVGLPLWIMALRKRGI